jgi:phage tail sheath gpL-like
MTAAYRNEDSFGEVWYGPLADGGGTAATGSVLFAGPATAAGVLHLWVAGTDLAVIVTSGMTAAQIATAVAAAVTANANLPVTATASTATVNFTAKNAGLGGNDIDLRMNYRASAGQVTPVGVTATITAMASGATNPTLTTLLSNLGDKEFDFIVCPYNDATSLTALTAFMNDQVGVSSCSAASLLRSGELSVRRRRSVLA